MEKEKLLGGKMNKVIRMISVTMFTLGVVVSSAVFALAADKKSKPEVFYVYSESGSKLNHFAESGWMGDFGDLRLDPRWNKGVAKPAKKAPKGKKAESEAEMAKDETCFKVTYSSERKQGNGWAGIFWQQPANNWGDKKGGFDLTGYSKMVFWGKGDKGGETVDKFQLGGIAGKTEEGDSDDAYVGPVVLTDKWTEYSIDLTGLDLSHIIGGFMFVVNADTNPNGCVFYIDEVRLVK
jgi:hypothetical protein